MGTTILDWWSRLDSSGGNSPTMGEPDARCTKAEWTVARRRPFLTWCILSDPGTKKGLMFVRAAGKVGAGKVRIAR